MIRYTLRCVEGHDFDSWFANAAAFDALAGAGHLACAVCGSGDVSKSLMAPGVSASRNDPDTVADARVPVLTNPASDVEKAVADLRRKVEETSDYVGRDFAATARAMHEGAEPERSIWGEARVDQARRLAQDGVPVVPLPFGPPRKKLT